MFCKECSKRSKCSKICKELEKTLPHNQDGRLKGEFSISNDLIDKGFSKEKDNSITDLSKTNNKSIEY